MNRIQVSYLFLLMAVLTFLVALATLFFAATDSKNALGLSAVAVFWGIVCAFWVYRFVKARRTL